MRNVPAFALTKEDIAALVERGIIIKPPEPKQGPIVPLSQPKGCKVCGREIKARGNVKTCAGKCREIHKQRYARVAKMPCWIKDGKDINMLKQAIIWSWQKQDRKRIFAKLKRLNWSGTRARLDTLLGDKFLCTIVMKEM